MESMTGYAFMERNTEQFLYSVEVKSLNSKYLEIYINLPKILRHSENEYTQIIKKYFIRGKIELNIDLYEWSNTKLVSLNTDLLKKYYQELENLRKLLKIREPLKIESLLMIEGITQRERTIISDKSRSDLANTLESAIKKTIEMRKKEGISIKKDINTSLQIIKKSVANIKLISHKSLEKKRESLKTKLKDVSEIASDNTRLFTEIAILTDKLDINEELVRIDDHLTKFKVVMKEESQVGRKLDFLSQELFREVNTIASKSNSSEISHSVVDIKNHIDKIREHCRNVV